MITQQSLSDRSNALAQVTIFRTLEPSVRLALAEYSRLQSYGTGETVLHQGDPKTGLFIVQRGVIKMVHSEPGTDVLLALVVAGEFFGDMSLLDGQTRSASAVALEPTELVVLRREAFLSCVRLYPEVALSLLEELSQRLRRSDKFVANQVNYNLHGRIIQKVLELAERFGHATEEGLVIRVPLRQQELADMVSGSREQVNRHLTQLEQEGLLRWDRRHFTLLQPEKLRAWFNSIT